MASSNRPQSLPYDHEHVKIEERDVGTGKFLEESVKDAESHDDARV